VVFGRLFSFLEDVHQPALAEFLDEYGEFEDFLLAQFLDEGLDFIGRERAGETRHRLDDLAGLVGRVLGWRNRQRPIDELAVLVITKPQLVLVSVLRRHDLDHAVAVLPLVDRLFEYRSTLFGSRLLVK
jgi:hypothetical protein